MGAAAVPVLTAVASAVAGQVVANMMRKDAPAPAAGPAPSPVADEAATQDAARAKMVARKRAGAMMGAPRSLLATAGGAAGDTSTGIGMAAGAYPAGKTTLGA